MGSFGAGARSISAGLFRCVWIGRFRGVFLGRWIFGRCDGWRGASFERLGLLTLFCVSFVWVY